MKDTKNDKKCKFRIYDKRVIKNEALLFSNKTLTALLLPIVVEQLLNSFMGMADTMMVSNLGSQAISAVSLVDSINNLVIQMFSALATGAAIICSQYIGNKDVKGCNKAASQVVITVLCISAFITAGGLIFHKSILSLIFGKIEQGVMDKAIIYFMLSVMSYPFLALFNAGSAFFRAGGNSRFPMRVSLIANVLNIAGNALLIFVLNMGVCGAALATLISRAFCMIVVFVHLRRPKGIIVVNNYSSIRPDKKLIKKILAIGVPSGVENSMFQFGKLAIQSTVSTMGTTAIAAQAMTSVLENVNGIFGIGVGIGLMTVVGQCIGAGKKEQARYYIAKLTLIAEIGLFLSCLFAYAIARPVTIIGGMEQESANMCLYMITAITIVKPLVWTLSFVPAYGMRAAGDVKFSMIVSSCTMWGLRVLLCIFVANYFHTGPIAVWIGMFADWSIRAVIFSLRFLSGKWLKEKMV